MAMRSSPKNKIFIFLRLLCYNHELSIAHHNVKEKEKFNHSSQKVTVRRIVVAKGMVFMLWLVTDIVKHKIAEGKEERLMFSGLLQAHDWLEFWRWLFGKK